MGARVQVPVFSVLSFSLLLFIPFPAFGQITVAISPNQTNVPASGTLQFTATVTGTTNTAVTWSVLEVASGGTVTSMGLYTAPAYPGTFHVVATSQADTSQSTSAIAVVPGFLVPDVRVETVGPTATVLQNGKVLLAGGGEIPSAASDNAEIYDPVTNTFALTSNMTQPRQSHAAALLAGGQVLIAGGGSPSLATAELYDPVAGTFTATGSMEIPRGGLTATTLPNRQVLVTGGNNCPTNCVVTNTAELYVPSSGTFVPTGNMNVQRIYHTATLLPNGQVLIAGGLDQNGQPLNSTEIYNPSTSAFTLGPSMSISGQSFTATLLSDGRVLLAGGSTATGTPIGSAEIYDPATNTIASTGNLNFPRYSATAALLGNGQVLIAGGVGSFGYIADAELFDPATGAFALTGPLNVPRFEHTETPLPNGQVLIAGGNDGGPIESAELYNPASGLFTTKTAVLRTPRTFHTQTTLADGRILVAGGVNCPVYPCSVLNSAEIYDPSVRQFAFTASMANARFAHTATLLNNRQVLIAGGWSAAPTATSGAQSPLGSAELYDPVANVFSPTGSLVTARGYHTATLLPNGQVLITGGQGTAGDLSSAEIYDPSSGTFSAIGNMTSTRYLHTATLLDTGEVLIAGGAKTTAIGPAPSFLATAELFNPSSGSFTPTGQLLAAPVRNTATLLGNGRVLIGNGAVGSQYYDPPTGQFFDTGIAGNQSQIEAAAALLPNGQVLVAGGAGLANGSVAYVYDPSAGTFSPGGNMASDHVNATASSLSNGNIVIAGGDSYDFQPSDPSFIGEREVDIYNSPLPVGAPALTSVTPNTLMGFNPVTIAIQGSGFLPNAVAMIDNTPLATTFVSATELTAVVPQDQLAMVGNRDISASNTGGPSVPPIAILIQNPLIGLSLPGIESDGSPAMDFGNVPVGGPSGSLSATLGAGGNAPLVFGAISITGTNPDDFSLGSSSTCPLAGGTLPVSATCIINVGFTPTLSGLRDAQISVPSNSMPNPDTLALAGTGTASPNNSFSPSSLTFANQQAGTSSQPQAIALNNSGNLSLTISYIGLSNPNNFSQTNNCPSTLAAAASCAITVSFVPGTTGSLSNAIVVDDNAPGTVPGIAATVPLSGNGTNLSLAPAGGGSSSASANRGQPATFSLQASPSGFSGTVTLSVNCSTVPTSTCNASPNPLTVSPAAPSPFTVSVTPTANGSGNAPNLLLFRTDHPMSFLVILSGLISALFLTLQVCRNAHRHGPGTRIAAGSAVAFLLAALVGCATGGGGAATATGTSGTTSSVPVTPSGAYTVVVTAQGQGVTQTVSLNLVVK